MAKVSKKTGKKLGRPTIYTDKLGDEICLRMCMGESVKAIGRDSGMPDAVTIFRWAIDPDHPFCHQYANARRIRAETLVDEITEISDFGTDHQRDRLRVDTRKWFAGKVAPKIYGDKLGLTNADGDGPVHIIVNESGKGSRAD